MERVKSQNVFMRQVGQATTAPTAEPRWTEVRKMGDKCEKCTEKCPQAEMAHQAALGRMYATKEFTALLKKVESGELVEVVRCKDCKWWDCYGDDEGHKGDCLELELDCCMYEDDFCSYGERRNSPNDSKKER